MPESKKRFIFHLAKEQKLKRYNSGEEQKMINQIFEDNHLKILSFKVTYNLVVDIL